MAAGRVFLLLASALVLTPALRLEGQLVASNPSYEQDCGKKLPVATSLAQLSRANEGRMPGAGVDPAAIEPYMTVLKDGFWEVACVKDYLLEHGDKFGANKFSYKLGVRANVSIVRYLEHVPREKQDPMSHKVCFNFCRSVPLMSFFGLANGRDCYCAPFFEQMAGDSSECNLPCEGDTEAMCGGKSKSSVFQMHECGDTAQELVEVAASMSDLSKSLKQLLGEGEDAASGLNKSASAMQPMFGELVNPAAYQLMQEAKAAAREVGAAVKAAGGKVDGLLQLMDQAAALEGADLKSEENMAKAEATVEKAEDHIADTEAAAGALSDFVQRVKGPEGGSLSTYKAVTYFIDKEFEASPSTCGGPTLGVPLLGATPEACAAACDAEVMACNGFSYFAAADVPVCFLLSELTAASWYTGPGCKAAAKQDHKPALHPSFLAVSRASGPGAPADTKCYAKFQNFEGVSLKPDPSGKCKLCLKTASNLDSCPLPH